VNGKAEPTDTFPLYAKTNGTQTGSTTWRCQECHGWDYRGSEGEYASGPHFTGVAGVFDRVATRTNQELIDVITNGTPPASGGSALTGTDHAFSSMLGTVDIEALVHFLRNGLVDTTALIGADGRATGDATAGAALYAASSPDPHAVVGECALCHGTDGKTLDTGAPGTPVFLGAIANTEPWQTLHQTRWGVPGSSMPSVVNAGIPTDAQSDLLAYLQTLPAQ